MASFIDEFINSLPMFIFVAIMAFSFISASVWTPAMQNSLPGYIRLTILFFVTLVFTNKYRANQ